MTTDSRTLVLACLAAALYAAATLICALGLRSAEPARTLRLSRVALWHAVAALVMHALALDGDLIQPDGWRFDFGNALSLFVWQCALVLTLFALHRPATHLGLVVFPAAAAGALIGALTPVGAAAADTVSLGPGWPLRAHILLSLLAYSLLTLAAVQACALAWQDRKLRPQSQQPLPAMANLPALETMEETLFQLIALGFALLTLALLSGLVFVNDLFAQHLAHKTVLSIIAWGVFAILLWGRWRSGWRGRTALRWTLAGYSVLLLAYFGSKFVLEILLGRHWS
ncbi:MAG: cytochrome C assembly family protein [Nevskiales bacterium]